MKFTNLKWLLRSILVLTLIVSCKPKDPFSLSNSDEGKFPAYPELPECENNNNYIYVSHDVEVRGRTMRNFSLCFDKTKYAARWVAYPLHACYRGSTDRSYESKDSWPYDPLINSSIQAVGKGGYSGYNRGHQIPSADRNGTREMNRQTFYMSNITPQAGDFNGGIWLQLENKVRDYICKDTLYVVTGAHWNDGYSLAGGRYPVPTHYYKVVLRTRSGNTGKSVYTASRKELKCIGFWFSHKATGTLNKTYCMSVADIERLTGFTFFPTLDVDKTACVPSDWGIGY